jgi:hypothetical protein
MLDKRNCTLKPQTYFRPTHFVATKDGNVLKRKDDNGLNLIQITMSPETTLFPQTQKRDQETLNKIYDLTQNGEYFFQAVCNHPEVASQKVSILIKN